MVVEPTCWLAAASGTEGGCSLQSVKPIWEHVKFKVVCLVCQSLSRQAPLYLADDCCLVSDSTRHFQRSDDVPTCMVPRTFGSYGDRTFAAAGPRLWNSLLNPDITYGLFRRQLKGHLFHQAWTQRSVTYDMWRFRKTLTYLLNYCREHAADVFCYCLTSALYIELIVTVIDSS